VSRLVKVLAFVYDFVVGDDWRLAVAVVLGLVAAAALDSHDVAAWWVLPVVVAVSLGWSLRRARSSVPPR
jgi:hypothetical protein